MTNAELIKALRICSSQPCCDNCPRYDIDHAQETNDCCVNLLTDAADAIERLMDEVDRKDKAIQGLLTQIERKDKTIERMRDLMKHYKAAYKTAYKLYQEARHGN